MWNKLFEELNNDFSNGIILRDFIKVDKNLKNFKTISISMSLPQQGIKIDDNIILSTILKEINQNIYKSIIREIISNNTNNTNNTFVDLRNEGNPRNIINKLSQSIQIENYKYCVTNTRLASDLADSADFYFSGLQNNKSVTSSSFVYLTGKLGFKDIYADPYMRYNDYKIFLFDDISLNVENFTTAIISEATFTPKLVVKFDYCLSVSPVKTINIIDSVNSDALLELKAEHREQQIDKILNKKESF